MIRGRREIRALLKLGEHRFQFTTRRRVRLLDELVQYRVLGLVDGLRSAGRRRLPTGRTVLVMGRQRRRAVPAGLPDAVRALLVVDDASLPEDIVVVLGRRDVLVGLPHVRIERPVDAMLDLGARIPLANHPRDSRMSERVRVRRLVDVGAVGDPAELLPHRVRRHAPVVRPPVVAITSGRFELVEQRDVGIVRPRVGRVQVRSDRRRGVDQRVLRDVGALQAARLAIRRVGRRRLEGNVPNAERQRHRESAPGVGEELDERHVTLVSRGRDQGVDVGLGEDFVGRRPILVDARPVDVLDPLDVSHLVEEQQDGVLVALNRRVREIVLVAQHEHEVVVGVLVERHERLVGALAAEAAAPEVDLHAREFDPTVEPAEPSTDRLAVGVEDGFGVGESLPLLLEAASEILGIVKRHTPMASGGYYKLTTRETTCSISCETPEAAPQAADKPHFGIETPAESHRRQPPGVTA